MRGRKPKPESRGTEIRARLAEWKRTPDFSRPSLRALAHELGTSHQLLSFYLKRLEKWQSEEYLRQVGEIRARANAEDRPLTRWEEEQVRAYTGAAIRTMVIPALLDNIELIKQDAKRGPLNYYQIKILKLLAREFPEAREILRTCPRGKAKRKKLELSQEQQELMKTLPEAAARRYVRWLQPDE